MTKRYLNYLDVKLCIWTWIKIKIKDTGFNKKEIFEQKEMMEHVRWMYERNNLGKGNSKNKGREVEVKRQWEEQ